MKKVSVVIPAYNKADLTVKTIESVLNQTYPNIEIIVVDDGSTDSTKIKLSLFANKIRYVYKENGGACSARNLGIQLAEGEYIALLDCDDLYLPQKIELCIDYLKKHPDFGFVHTAAYFIDGKSRILRTFSHYKSRRVGWIAKSLLFRNFICNSTVIVRKACFEKVGFFNEKIFTPADWDMWLKLAEKYKVGYIDIPLTSYRISESYILEHIEQAKREEVIVLEAAFQRNSELKLGFKNKVFSNLYQRHAVSYLLVGNFKKTKQELVLSIQENKLNIITILLLVYFAIAPRSLQFLAKKKVYHNFNLFCLFKKIN